MKHELVASVQTGGWYGPLFADENVEEAFRFIRECGFQAVDFSFSKKIPTGELRQGILTDFFDADIPSLLAYYRPVKEAAQKHGIFIGQAHAPFPTYVEGYPEVNEYLLAAVEKQCAICQFLGCPALVVHPAVVTCKEQERELNLQMYRRLMPAAKKYGVKICLENMFTTENGRKVARACSNMEDACYYIDTLNGEAGESLFGFCYDVGHANLTANDILQDIRTLGHRLTLLHIHGNDCVRDLHQIPYLARTSKKSFSTDWEAFLQGLREIGYRGTLNMETAGSLALLPEELIEPVLKVASAVCAYFKRRILNDV